MAAFFLLALDGNYHVAMRPGPDDLSLNLKCHDHYCRDRAPHIETGRLFQSNEGIDSYVITLHFEFSMGNSTLKRHGGTLRLT